MSIAEASVISCLTEFLNSFADVVGEVVVAVAAVVFVVVAGDVVAVAVNVSAVEPSPCLSLTCFDPCLFCAVFNVADRPSSSSNIDELSNSS